MPPALDIGSAVYPLTVTDRQVDAFEILPGGAKQQVKIAEGVKIAEIPAVSGDAVILFFPHGLGAA